MRKPSGDKLPPDQRMGQAPMGRLPARFPPGPPLRGRGPPPHMGPLPPPFPPHPQDGPPRLGPPGFHHGPPQGEQQLEYMVTVSDVHLFHFQTAGPPHGHVLPPHMGPPPHGMDLVGPDVYRHGAPPFPPHHPLPHPPHRQDVLPHPPFPPYDVMVLSAVHTCVMVWL